MKRMKMKQLVQQLVLNEEKTTGNAEDDEDEDEEKKKIVKIVKKMKMKMKMKMKKKLQLEQVVKKESSNRSK